MRHLHRGFWELDVTRTGERHAARTYHAGTILLRLDAALYLSSWRRKCKMTRRLDRRANVSCFVCVLSRDVGAFIVIWGCELAIQKAISYNDSTRTIKHNGELYFLPIGNKNTRVFFTCNNLHEPLVDYFVHCCIRTSRLFYNPLNPFSWEYAWHP